MTGRIDAVPNPIRVADAVAAESCAFEIESSRL